MPFDSETYVEIPDLTKPSLEGLSYILRNLSTVLPKHKYCHRLYYTENTCGTVGCAYGICQIVWGDAVLRIEDRFEGDYVQTADALFGHEAYDMIFSSLAYSIDILPVTPTMVADRIDEILAGKYQ